MDKTPIKKPGIYLILISSAFLAMWILGALSLSQIIREDSHHIFLFYLLSLFIPLVGIILFMNNIRDKSPRWYWGIPLLFSLVLITLQRDMGILGFYYGISFIEKYDTSNILRNDALVYFSQLAFIISSALFTLSVPEENKAKMIIPFRISLITLTSVLIFIIINILVDWKIISFTTIQSNFWGLYVVGIFIFGLSLIWVAFRYKN